MDDFDRFQSTLPVGGATVKAALSMALFKFQSTLPVGGATGIVLAARWISPSFNPRSPWGERRETTSTTSPAGSFNPRSPWGERRAWTAGASPARSSFNPRSPWGERRGDISQELTNVLFQSTLPVGGATPSRR